MLWRALLVINVYSPDFSSQKIFDFIMFYYDNMERRHLPLFQSGPQVAHSGG